MSRTSVLYFEYKEKSAWEWKLFAPLVKKSDLYLDYHYLLRDPVVIDGEEYVHSFQDDIQGTIRDYLNDNYREFNYRGFPKDMSPELSAFIEKQKKNEGLDGSWGHSWVDVDELINVIKDDYNRNKESICSYTSKSEFTKLHDKLDIILKTIKKETITSTTNTDDNEDTNYDYIEYINELTEENECLDYAREYLEGVKLMIAILNNAWPDTYDVRIVYFTC